MEHTQLTGADLQRRRLPANCYVSVLIRVQVLVEMKDCVGRDCKRPVNRKSATIKSTIHHIQGGDGGNAQQCFLSIRLGSLDYPEVRQDIVSKRTQQ